MNENKKSKRQERRVKAEQKARTSRLLTMGLIVVGVALVVLLAISQQAKSSAVGTILPAEARTRPNVDHNSMGDPKAPIQIAEYADFQCPYCKQFFDSTEASLTDNFVATGKIYYTYHSAGNWVSQNIGGADTESQDSAAAAYCAADQGKFWEMHDALFTNNRDAENQGSFSSKRLTAIAQSVGLDMTAYQSCYDKGTYKKQVQQDFTDATAAGINGTPFFVMTYKVKGETKTETIDGAQPITAFQQKIEAALLIADKQ
jgi:protein-disulfide isomerase